MTIKSLLLPLLLALSSACSNAVDLDPDSSPIFVDAGASRADAAPRGDIDAASAPTSLRINEVLKNSPGPDDTHEFIEVYGPKNTDLSDFSLLILEGDATAASTIGTLDMHIELGTTDSEGFYVTEFFAGKLENGSISLLLVRGFDNSIEIDTDLDTNDDGQLDLRPWQELLDSLAFIDDPQDTGYSPTLLTNDLGGKAEEFVGASRFPDGLHTGALSDWVRANSEGVGLEGVQGAGGAACDGCGLVLPIAGRAIITPGTSNQIVSDS